MVERVSLKNVLISFAAILLCFAASVGIIITYSILNGGTIYDYSIRENINIFSVIFILFLAFYIYLFYVDKGITRSMRDLIVVVLGVVISLAMNLFISTFLSMDFRPYVFMWLVIMLILGKRTAVLMSIFFSMLMLFVDFFFTKDVSLLTVILTNTLLSTVGGLLFIFLIGNTRKRVSAVWTALKMSLVFGILGASIEVFNGLSIQVLYSGLWAMGSSLLTVILFMSILPLFESLFNYVTDYRLFEMTDHSNKLLEEFFSKASGTFNHSIMVANLTEICAKAIGENSNLARACAYYHDIGKMKNVVYFKENQKDSLNPHDDIMPEVSVHIIKSHVENGIEIARANRLPKEIIGAIAEHHGTLPIKFFYHKAQKYTDGNVDLASFSYDGPKPTTKINAIIMIVDACEAAVRVMSDRTKEKVRELVESIVEERIRLNQFINCPITFRDLNIIKKELVSSLAAVYHERIAYPDVQITAEVKKDA